MHKSQWQTFAPRAILLTGVFALGSFAAIALRGYAGQHSNETPVQPPIQALSMQTAFEDVADKLRPSVVFIKSRQTVSTPLLFRQEQNPGDSPFGFQFPNQRGPNMAPRKAIASGSGLIVRSDGYILTNDHVVDGSDKVTVQLQDGREFVGKVKEDFRSDLALIKIEASNLPAVQMADSDRVRIGQWAIAFGSPFGLSDTMTVGVISSLHRQEAIGAGKDGRLYPSLIQTDASINPGNSGGPLVDIYGRVVGINVAIESPSGTSAGIGFAIPSNTAKYIVDELIAKGSVTRGFLGLAPVAPTYDQKQRYGVREGALVKSVQDGTPAQRAGFQVGDVIIRYDGKPVTDDALLREMAARTHPGQRVDVVIKRGGQEVTLTPTIGEAPEAKPTPTVTPEVKQAVQGKLGVRVVNSDDAQARESLSLKGVLPKGALLIEVRPGSPAGDAGLQPGDIILRLNNQPVASGAQLGEVAQSLKPGSVVDVVVRRQIDSGSQTQLVQITLE